MTGASDPAAPRPCLGVGVTGHRLAGLEPDSLPSLRARIMAVLERLEATASLESPQCLRLVTGLAQGADSIAAECALERGWRLDSVLPFPRDDYAEDHQPAEANARYLANLAASEAVYELGGVRDANGMSGAAYERAGRVVLEQCDILIAVWDGKPARGRGGSAQIIAEAVADGIPVIHLDSHAEGAPKLLWSGLEEVDLGSQTVDSVARLELDALPSVVTPLLSAPADAGERSIVGRFEAVGERRLSLAVAYPVLLALFGVRRLRKSDFDGRLDLAGSSEQIASHCRDDGPFCGRMNGILLPRFAESDAVARRSSQLFRSAYVGNFGFAALAVSLSLLGLVLPHSFKPLLVSIELVIIALILIQTRTGNRANWHALWLDNRALAERLRCLSIASRLGILDLRAHAKETAEWVAWCVRATAREVGLPSAHVDEAYLGRVREDLVELIDGQTDYMRTDASRMHRMDHRLHLLGTTLFGLTALACIFLLGIKAAGMVESNVEHLADRATLIVTILTAALPAVGAAIYGIRMQSDFAGIAQRNQELGEDLAALRRLIVAEPLDFDILNLRTRRVTSLLTADLSDWLHTFHARPLALPG
ncbi:hypothetical protein [Tsuneonella mangrovi]|uniref:hypothetical protein n=1 Tax=Tsuneonella mangrovi TaxID=1982042 RepID=UPI0012371FA2|nr:hypothetical protein [Tsuneonella mangrovi]